MDGTGGAGGGDGYRGGRGGNSGLAVYRNDYVNLVSTSLNFSKMIL